MNSSKARAKTAGPLLVDLGLYSRNGNLPSGSDFLAPSRPRNEHPLNCVTFPNTKSEAQMSSQWIGSPLPVPKQSHSARRFAKPATLVNLLNLAIPPDLSPLLPSRSTHLNMNRLRRNLDTSPVKNNNNPGPVSSPPRRRKFNNNQSNNNKRLDRSPERLPKNGLVSSTLTSKASEKNKLTNSSSKGQPAAEGKALLEPSEAALQLVPVSTFSLVKCPGTSNNLIGERMQVIRTEEERMKNPDTIRLDKCGLKQFPLVSVTAEQNLKLLSMQHNQITKLENVPSLNYLVVLDLYDNRIERICGLQGLNSLRVLLLGKNRLRRIEGLDGLKRLEVLDLHGNQLRYVDNLGCLTSLRVLNLAGNNFKTIRLGSFGLTSLVELNLKRNRIRSLEGLQRAPHLKKLLLANNEIASTASLAPLRKLVFLQEVLFDPNPMCSSHDYNNHVLTVFPWLEVLDRSPVTDEMRADAKSWHRKRAAEEEERKQEQIRAKLPSSREEVIFEARRRWQSVKNFVKNASTPREPDKKSKASAKRKSTSMLELAKEIVAMTPDKVKLPELRVKEELPRVASDSQLFRNEPSLSTKMQLETQLEAVTVLSDPEECLPGDGSLKTRPQKFQKEPSKIAVVRPLVRSNVDLTSEVPNPSDGLDKMSAAHSDPKLDDDIPSLNPDSDKMTERSDLVEDRISDEGKEQPNPRIEITNFEDETSAILLDDQDMDSKSDLSSITAQDQDIIPQVGSEMPETEDSSQAEPILPQNYSEISDNIETNLNSVAESIENNLSQIASIGSTANSPMKPEEDDHDNGPGDLLDIFPKPKNRARMLKRSVSSINLIPDESAMTFEGVNKQGSARVFSANASNNISSEKSSRLQLMRNLRSASFDTRYPSSESESSDDTSSFLTANTSDTSIGNVKGSRKLFTRTRSKIKKDRQGLKNQFGIGRRPQTGTRDSYYKTVNPNRPLKRCDSATSDMSSSLATAIKKQGADYLVEIDGKILNVYGQGALKFTLMGFPTTLASTITTAKFNYISFDTIIPYFGKLRQIYPGLEHFQFRANNISTLAQLNALADLQGVTTVHITKEGNPISGNELWQSYAAYRLSHWGLKNINGKDVSSEFKNGSVTKCFDSLGYVALSCLPQTALTPLAKRLHTLHCFCCCSPSSSSDDSARKTKGAGPSGAVDTPSSVCNSWDDDPVLLDVIGKEALVYNPPTAMKDPAEERTEVPGKIITAGVEILQKLDLLESSWTSVLNELVQDILMDYLLMDSYMKREYKKLQDIALIKKFP